MADKKTSKNFTDGINQSINNTRNSLIAEIEGERLLAKRITQDRIKRLEEAYVIAQKLDIQDRVENSKNIIISDDKNIMAESQLYLYGTKSLRAEIDVLARRDSFDAFIPNLRSLEQKAEGLKNISVNSSDVRSAEIDQVANPPLHRFKPKRKIIVLVGGMIGGLISFIYLLYLMVIRREYIS
jgi:chain length determinant protein (polysaccharide antigen chain regulator)